MFLHELTNNYKLGDKQIQKGYRKYLEKNSISIKSKIPEDQIFMFNTQGEIRGIFDKDGLKPDSYLKQFYPTEINATKYREIVNDELNNLYKALELKFTFDLHKKELPSVTISTSEFEPLSLTFIGKKPKIQEKDVRELVDGLELIQADIEKIKSNKILEEKDKEFLDRMLEPFSIMQDKYGKKLREIKDENVRINKYSTYINTYKNQYSKKITDEQAIYSEFINNKESLIESIVNLIREEKNLIEYKPSNIDVPIEAETNPVDKYLFVSKLGVDKIDTNYVNDLLAGVLKKGKRIDTLSITKEELKGWIKNNTEEDNQISALKSKIDSILDKDFSPRNSIIEAGMDVYQEVSSGFDAQMYFTLISGETGDKGIYLIDQPEDHISQKAIKTKVLDQFRRMGGCRQIIMVTHNPQFIINLDVDNVVFLSNEEGKFNVESGALEYENDEYSVLDIVAENVEGGLAQIQGRLKRYEKKIYTE